MADAKKNEAAADGEQPVKKKSKLLLIIIIAVLVLVLGGGGAAFFLLKKKASDEEDSGEDAEAPKTKVEKKKKKDAHAEPPAFVKLEPFVVKLQGEQENYAQAIPELKLAEAHAADQVKQFTPEIRHKVLLILAGKKAADLGTPDGMQMLANQIRVAINSTLTGEKPKEGAEKANEDHDGPVLAVYFSSLIVQ
jgi:flagellar FliL protein